jgi:hypothetical protein
MGAILGCEQAQENRLGSDGPRRLAQACGAMYPRLLTIVVSQQVGRGLPVLPYFKCFRRFTLMFQVFHLDYCKSRYGMLHMLQWQYMHIASLCFKCFRWLRCIFQVFHLNVAYVTMAIHVCSKRMFWVFQMFQIYVAHLSSECCKSRSKCYICCYSSTCMFQVFRLFQMYVGSVLFRCFKSTPSIYKRMQFSFFEKSNNVNFY